VGELADDRAFAALLDEWLQSSEIAHTIESQPSLTLADLENTRTSGPAVRIWLVLRTPEELRLYLAEPSDRRFLVRDIPLRSNLDEVDRERAAQVVLTSALAFIERQASTPWSEVERAFSEPLDAPAAAVGTRQAAHAPTMHHVGERRGKVPSWDLGAGAWYGIVASDGPAHGPGALVDLGLATGHLRVSAIARGLYRFWPELSSPRVRVEARGPAIGISGAAELVLESAFRPFLEVGAGLDFVHVAPQNVPESNVDARPAYDDVRAFGVLSTGVKWRAWRVWAGAGTRLEWAFADTHYDVSTERGPEHELALPRFRPGGFVEFGWLIAIGE
jgi:hypothetical protein